MSINKILYCRMTIHFIVQEEELSDHSMGRPLCCEKVGLKKGSWTSEEDQKLMSYVQEHGHGSWRALPAKAGLQRCGKSCRLRWTNYLRPDIKRGKFSSQEEQTIIQLHALLGNRWSAIATHLPKRTDNEIKNYWNTHLKKRLTKMGIDPVTHKPKNYALGGTGQSKDVANLSHMAQWESARLEAEARFVQYRLSPQLFQTQSKQGRRSSAAPLPITHSSAPPETLASGSYPFNLSENILPADMHCWNDWNKVPAPAPPFPDTHCSEEESIWMNADSSEGNYNTVISCVSFNVDGFSHQILLEDSNYDHNGNCATAGSVAGCFEENNHYWNNITSLLDSSSFVFSWDNV